MKSTLSRALGVGLFASLISLHVVFAGNTTYVNYNGNTTINWSVSNAAACQTSKNYPNAQTSDQTAPNYIDWSGNVPSTGSRDFKNLTNAGTWYFKCSTTDPYSFINYSDTAYVNVCSQSQLAVNGTCLDNPAPSITLTPTTPETIVLGDTINYTLSVAETTNNSYLQDVTALTFNHIKPDGSAWTWPGNWATSTIGGVTNQSGASLFSETGSYSYTFTYTPAADGTYTLYGAANDSATVNPINNRWTSGANRTIVVCKTDEYVQAAGLCVKIPIATLAVSQSNPHQITWTCTNANSFALRQDGSIVSVKTFTNTDSGNYTVLSGKEYSAVCTNSYGRASTDVTYTAPTFAVSNGVTDGRLATYSWTCPAPATSAIVSRVIGGNTVSNDPLSVSGTVTTNAVVLGSTYTYTLACMQGSTYTGSIDASLTTPTPISLQITNPVPVAQGDTATITWTSDGTVCQLENYNRTQILKSGITKINGYFSVSLSPSSNPSIPQIYGTYGYYIKCTDGTAQNRMSTDENLALGDANKKATVIVTGSTFASITVKATAPGQLTWQCTNANHATLTKTVQGVTTTVTDVSLPPNSGSFTPIAGASYDLSCALLPNAPVTAHYDPPILSVASAGMRNINMTWNCVDTNAKSMILARSPGWVTAASSTLSATLTPDTNDLVGSTSYTYTLWCYDGPLVGGAQSGSLIGYTTATTVTVADQCSNRATNPMACNLCPSDLVWDGASCVPPSPNPTVSLLVEPNHVPSGGSALLSWGSQNATGGCTATGGWNGTRATQGSESTGEITGAPGISDVFTLSCSGGLGSNPVSTSVTVTIQPNATGMLTPSTCTMAINGSSCGATIAWTTSNTIGNVTVTDDNGQSFVTGGAPASPTSRSISYGSHAFVLKDDGNTLSTATFTANCPLGYPWNGTKCAAPTPASGILNSGSCTIAQGASSCTVSVTWSTSNTSGTVTVRNENNGVEASGAQGPGTAIITYGSHVFALKDEANQLDTGTFTANCASGTWNGTSCTTPASPTGSLSSASCTISNGASTCSVPVSWTTSNTIGNVTVTDDNGQSFVTGGAPASPTSRSISYGSHAFVLKDDGNTLDTTSFNAGCTDGQWNGSTCMGPTTGIITPTPCIITAGQSSCSMSVAWQASNTLSTVTVKNDASYIGGGTNSGTVSATVTYGSHTSTLYDGPTNLLDTKTSFIGCANGTLWNGSTCQITLATTGFMTPASCIIPAGQSSCNATISWTTANATNTVRITRDYDDDSLVISSNGPSNGGTYNAIFTGKGTYPMTMRHVGDVNPLGYATYSADCALGTLWSGTICALPASGVLTSSSCTIPLGQSSCGITLQWTTAHATSTVNVTRDYVINPTTSVVTSSAAAANGGSYYAIFNAEGDYNMTLRHNAEELSHATFGVSCVSGTRWIDGACIVPPIVSGVLDSGSCIITTGASSCTIPITWTSSNATTTVSVTRDYANGSLVSSSIGSANGGSYTATFSGEGDYAMSLMYAGNAISHATYSSECASGTYWNGTVCAVPLIVSGELNPSPYASSCTIASGASSCTIAIVWTSVNATTTVSVTRDYDNGSQVTSSAGPANGGSYTATFSGEGSYDMSLTYAGNAISHATYASSCASNTTWNGSICAPPAPTGYLNPASCIIAIGASSCTMTIVWGTTNAIGPVTVVRTYDNNSTIPGGTGSQGSANLSFPSGSYTLTLMDQNKTVAIASPAATKTYTAACAANSHWNAETSVCDHDSSIFGLEAYITPTGVTSIQYSSSPASTSTSNGTFGQWSYRTTGSGINNCVIDQQDDNHGWYGNSATDPESYTKTYASYSSADRSWFTQAFATQHDWRVTCYGGNNQSTSIIWSLKREILPDTPDVTVTCNNGASNAPACDTCPNGQTLGTNASGATNTCVPICANGATNPITCTAVCPDGSITTPAGLCPGVCPDNKQLINGTCQVPPSECTNGALNFSACNICRVGDYYSITDQACHTPVCGNNLQELGEGCDGTQGITDAVRQACGAASSASACTITCTNGATDAPNCGACPSGKVLINNACVQACTNGALQSSAPTCTTCPLGKWYSPAGTCITPICGNSVVEANEVCDKQAGSYNHATSQCNDTCVTEAFGTLPEAQDEGSIPSIRISCPSADKYEVIQTSSGAVVASGSYVSPVTYTPTVSDTYKVTCIKVSTITGTELRSTPVLRTITPAVFTPHVVSLNVTPKTVQKGSPVTLTWDIANPNNLCTIIATPVVDSSCGFICKLVREDETSRLTSLLASTKTDTNDPYGNGDGSGRPMRDAITKVLINDGHARGKKTLQVNYSTTFTASCAPNALQDSTSQNSTVRVATSNEG